MNVTSLIKRAQELVGDHSTAILTAVGVAGTVTTAVLAGRAGYRAAQVIEEHEAPQYQGDERVHDTPKKTKVELTWKLYIPAAGSGAATITAIIFANRIGAKRTAAMAAAYGLSEKAFGEYKEKVKETLGVNKETKVRDQIAQDRVNNNPVGEKIVILSSGDILCFDATTGRYFMSTHETIQKAQNEVNRELINHSSCSLSAFYDMIGLPPTVYSEEVGWNLDHVMEVQYSTTMSTDDRPCLVIDFSVAPIRDYAKLY